MEPTGTSPSHDVSAPFLGGEPPHWAARGLAALLLIVLGAGVTGSIVIKVPETVRATFVLVPVGGADPIRAPRNGSVTTVRVAEGQTVRQGDPAFVLRAGSVGAGRAELEGLERHVAGTRERQALEREKHESQSRADGAEERRLEDRLVYLARRAEQTGTKRPVQEERYRSRLRALEAEAATLVREIEFKKGHLRLAREIASRHQVGYDRGFLSWMEYVKPQIEAERVGTDLAQLERRLEAAQERRVQLQAERRAEEIEWTLAVQEIEREGTDARGALARLRHESAARQAAFREADRHLREETDRAAIRITALSRELVNTATNEQTVLAPCTGTVLRLGARAAGAVVREGELLAEVACADTRLLAELTLPRNGVSRLRPGLGVKVLYDAFPYQRHGVRHGTVRWVSPASVSTDGPATFRGHVEIADTAIRVDGESRPLMAGMTGKAEVVVGRRALITYAFEPLRQLRENLAGVPDASVRRRASER
jgi:HlyD family secretion protein